MLKLTETRLNNIFDIGLYNNKKITNFDFSHIKYGNV